MFIVQTCNKYHQKTYSLLKKYYKLYYDCTLTRKGIYLDRLAGFISVDVAETSS